MNVDLPIRLFFIFKIGQVL